MPRASSVLIIALYAIFSLGMVMIFSTTSAEMLDQARDSGTHMPLLKQLLYAAQGFILLLVVYYTGWRRWLRWSPWLLALATLLLAAVFVPGLGRHVNGARRWIALGGISLQPSELFKYIAPLYLIGTYQRWHYTIPSYRAFLRFMLPLLPAMLLILFEPNNGTLAVVIAITVGLLFLMGVTAKYWALPLVALLCVAVGAFYTLPYVASRLETYLHPERDLLGRGHQPYQAKIAAGSGGLFGKGPGNSWQKFSYLPEAQNDYIAAIYAEEFGFVGMLALLLLYMILIGAMGNLALQTQERSALYLVTAVLLAQGLQAVLNLAVVSGLAPSTGLNLPFFSQGGSSLMANMAGIGLLLSASQKTAEQKTQVFSSEKSKAKVSNLAK